MMPQRLPFRHRQKRPFYILQEASISPSGAYRDDWSRPQSSASSLLKRERGISGKLIDICRRLDRPACLEEPDRACALQTELSNELLSLSSFSYLILSHAWLYILFIEPSSQLWLGWCIKIPLGGCAVICQAFLSCWTFRVFPMFCDYK